MAASRQEWSFASEARRASSISQSRKATKQGLDFEEIR
jgi:hypothetical protein